MILAIFIIFHLLVCIVMYLMLKFNVLKTHALMMPMVVFVPVSGFLILMLEEYMECNELMGVKNIELEKLKIQDIKYKRIEIDDSEDQDITVPLEEAIYVNDSQTRRKLMLDILQKNPEDYIDLLKRATMGNDTELTHYATTSMMEIQSNYEQTLHKLKDETITQPDDLRVLRRYRRELQKYINSGLISGNILKIYRTSLDEILIRITDMVPDSRKYLIEKLDNRIELGKFENIEEELKKLQTRWGRDEKVCMILVKYYYKINQGDKIKEVIEHIEDNNIYLTREGREWLEFWKRSNGTRYNEEV